MSGAGGFCGSVKVASPWPNGAVRDTFHGLAEKQFGRPYPAGFVVFPGHSGALLPGGRNKSV
jgi:hypothetical protein